MMQKPQIGMWMYQNGGGTEIENKLSYQLQDRNINVIKNIDLKNAVAHNGSLYCHDINLNQLDLFLGHVPLLIDPNSLLERVLGF